MDIKALVNAAKEHEDQSVATSGDYEYTPPAKGRTIGRFIEYIELGKHIEMFEGKPKPPAELVRLTFELLHPDRNIKEIEVDGGKKKVAERISVTVPKKMNEKAKFYKLFKSMAYGRTEITHMAEMLGEAFILNISHYEKQLDGGKKRVYANLYDAGVWGVMAPRNEDALSGQVTDISSMVPPALSPLRIFIWSNPTKETWDSLFIDGYNETKNADGTINRESKNWLQERIMSATDFGGSALQQMVAGLDKLPTTGDTPSTQRSNTQTQQSEPNTGATADAGAVGEAAVTATSTSVSTVSAEDALTALGL